ncbi:MAG: DUF2723 domain-containing protein [Chloroflexota bacterium]
MQISPGATIYPLDTDDPDTGYDTSIPPNGRLRYAPIIVGIILTVTAAILYIYTLAPSVMPGDYAEFQFSAAILGVPHPTGYPLYILLGKLFTLLPVGDVAYRVNLSSAVYMAGAVGLLYAVAVKLLRLAGLGRAWWAAAVGAALFAVSPTPWSMSLVARSYALNALLVGCVLYALISWRTTGRAGWFYATLFAIGLSMVHHGTTYLLLPAYGLYLLLVEIERRRKHTDTKLPARWALGVLSFLGGFSPMLFLVYRFVWGSPYYWGNPSTWKDFFNLLTGGPFHNQVLGFGNDLGTQLGRIAFGINELSIQYTPVGIAVGLLGIGALWRYRRAEAGLFILMLLFNFAFSMNYSLVGYLYFIPTYLLWGIFTGVGTGWLTYLLLTNIRDRFASVTILTAGGAMLIAALAIVTVLRYPTIDQSHQTQTRDQALALINAAPQGSTLYLDWEALSVVRFYRYVYGMRQDLTLHSGDPSDWAQAVYCDFNNGSTPFVGEFAGAKPMNIERDFTLEPAPMGWRITGITNRGLYEIPPCGTCATCR